MTARGEKSMELRQDRWTANDIAELAEMLRSEADQKYRDFHSSLVPNNEKTIFIGIRVPRLREISREISKGSPKSFLKAVTDDFYELRMLKAYVTGLVKTNSFDEFAELCDRFIKSVNSWAVCDGFCASLKEVNKYKPQFFEYINNYLESDNEWSVRVALVIMLDYYLEDAYIDEVLKRCDGVTNKAYYVSVAQAWLLATAVAKCSDKTMKYLLDNSLDDVTFNRTVQKCVESRRVDEKTKDFLRTLKRH